MGLTASSAYLSFRVSVVTDIVDRERIPQAPRGRGASCHGGYIA